MYCHTHQPSKEKELRRIHELKQFENKDSGQTIYIDTRWVVLYANDTQKIPVNKIRDCHRMINLMYGARNEEELNKVPDEHPYPFKSLIGNMNIQFLPLDETKVTVEYMKINGSLDDNNPVDDAESRAGNVPGVMNLYVGNCEKGILGQAALESNICFGLYSATGGYDQQGNFKPYHLGKTWAHEIGHALSLYHTFSDDACDGVATFSDIPETIRPNFKAEFYTNSQGKPSIRGDNRYLDRQDGTRLSCLHAETNPSSAPNDMACNVMDYGDDNISVMFSKAQAAQARSYLLSPNNTSIVLKSANSVSYSESHVSTTTSIDTTEGDSGSTSTSPGTTPVPDESGSIELSSNATGNKEVGNNDIGNNWLAGFITICVLLLIFMGTTAYYYQNYNKARYSMTFKHSSAENVSKS